MASPIVIRSLFPRVELRAGGKQEAWDAGTNGNNSLWLVWVWDGIDRPVAVAAQELWEHHFQWIAGLLLAIPFLIATWAAAWFLGPLNLLLAPIALGIGSLLSWKLHVVQRYKELRSHEIETQAAVIYYAADPVAYRLGEIGSVGHPEQGGMVSYAWLQDMTEEEIYNEMETHEAWAMQQVKRLSPILNKIKKLTL